MSRPLSPDEEIAIQALLTLSRSRPPCGDCGATGSRVTHASLNRPQCPGCPESVCASCFAGARYFCPLRARIGLPPPSSPLVRQQDIGVQTSRVQDLGKNKK